MILDWHHSTTPDERKTYAGAPIPGPLKLGTAGVRGKVGPGFGALNPVTVRMIAQAYSACFAKGRCFGIGYDTRHTSAAFAQQIASFLHRAGHRVALAPYPIPTPLLSWAIRHYGWDGGYMVTASHNPPEDNGIKLYDREGGQIVAPLDQQFLDAFHALAPPAAQPSCFCPSLWPHGAFDRYIEALFQKPPPLTTVTPVLYSPLSGVGGRYLAQAFSHYGVAQHQPIVPHVTPDGSFHAVANPNPEKAEAWQQIRTFAPERSLLLALDPDADRMGCWPFNGHELALLLLTTYLHYFPPKKGLMVRSLVTIPLLDTIATAHHLTPQQTLPGFRYIAASASNSSLPLFFGAEESLGYLFQEHAHDKDGIQSSLGMVLAQSWAESEGITLEEKLVKIYQKYGYQKSTTFTLPTRTLPHRPAHYKSVGLEAVAPNPAHTLEGGNCTVWQTKNDFVVLLRPSGTEPILKVYLYAPHVPYSRKKVAEIEEEMHTLEIEIRALIAHEL